MGTDFSQPVEEDLTPAQEDTHTVRAENNSANPEQSNTITPKQRGSIVHISHDEKLEDNVAGKACNKDEPIPALGNSVSITKEPASIIILGLKDLDSLRMGREVAEPIVRWLLQHPGVHVFKECQDTVMERLTPLYDRKALLLGHIAMSRVYTTALDWENVPIADRSGLVRDVFVKKVGLVVAMLSYPQKDTPIELLNSILPMYRLSGANERANLLCSFVMGWLENAHLNYMEIYQYYFGNNDPYKKHMNALLSLEPKDAFNLAMSRDVHEPHRADFVKIIRTAPDDSASERITAHINKNIDDLIVVFIEESRRSYLTLQLMINFKVFSEELTNIEGKLDLIFAPYIKDLKPFGALPPVFSNRGNRRSSRGLGDSGRATQQLEENKSVSSVSVSDGLQSKAHLWKENTINLYEEHHEMWEKYRVRKGWFLSYKQKDGSNTLVERLYNKLKGDNWYDMMHQRGRTRSAMIKGICRRDKFICFVSPNYFNSEWCCMELTIAMKCGKKIVPVYNQDQHTAGFCLNLVPECFQTLKENDFVGLFLDMGPCLGQIKKIEASIKREVPNEFDDSEEE